MRKIVLALIITASALSAIGQGVYLEYKIGSEKSGISGQSKIYAQDGNTRSVLTMVNPQVPGNHISTSLLLAKDPKNIYQLDDNQKTYSILPLGSQPALDEDPASYDITVAGREVIGKYNTTHLIVKRKGSTQAQELWVSTDLPNYNNYMKINSQYTKLGLVKAMTAKKVSGFPVRIKIKEQGMSLQIDLINAKEVNNEPGLFSLETYKKVDYPQAGGDAKEMMNKIQSMSPEEREKFLEQMRKKQQQQAPPPADTQK